MTAWCAGPLITAGHSRQGHGDLAVPARIVNAVLARVSNSRARTIPPDHRRPTRMVGLVRNLSRVADHSLAA